jgi:hypothetical protein
MRCPSYLLLLVIFLAQCRFQGNRIEGIPITDSYNKCEEAGYDFGEIITLGDSNNRFMVSLPYEWAIQESYSDTLYGIVASNIWEAGENPALFMSFSVTGYSTADSLHSYLMHELQTLKADKNMKVLETGETTLSERKAYWVKFRNTEKDNQFLNLVLYAKSPERGEIFLIHSCVADIAEPDKRLCAMKKLAMSFEFVTR